MPPKVKFQKKDIVNAALNVAKEKGIDAVTAREVAKELKARNANRVYVAATFGLFTNGLEKFDKAYEEGYITKLLTTNLTYQKPELFERPYYVCVDLSKYIALIIDTLNHNGSLADLLSPTDRINRFLAKHRREIGE